MKKIFLFLSLLFIVASAQAQSGGWGKLRPNYTQPGFVADLGVRDTLWFGDNSYMVTAASSSTVDSVVLWLDPIICFTDTIPVYPDSADTYIANRNIAGTPKNFRMNIWYQYNGTSWDSIVPLNTYGVIDESTGIISVYLGTIPTGDWIPQNLCKFITPDGYAVKGSTLLSGTGTFIMNRFYGQVVYCGNASGNQIIRLPAAGTGTTQMKRGSDFRFMVRPGTDIKAGGSLVILQNSSGTPLDTIVENSEILWAHAYGSTWKVINFGYTPAASTSYWTKSGDTIKPLTSTDFLDMNSWINSDSVYRYKGLNFMSMAGTDLLIGESAGRRVFGTNGGSSFNTFLGYNAGRDAGRTPAVTGCVFVGANAGQIDSTGINNTFVGANSGIVNDDGGANTFVGYASGTANTTANSNTFIGSGAGARNTTGSNNTFLGESSGFSSTTAYENCFIGHKSGYSLDGTGGGSSQNTIIGTLALSGASFTGATNVFIGHYAARLMTGGSDNVIIGAGAGAASFTASNNIMIGREAGYSGSGNNNIWIGKESGGLNASGTGNICLGNFSGNRSRESNRLFIHNKAYGDSLKERLNSVVSGIIADSSYNSLHQFNANVMIKHATLYKGSDTLRLDSLTGITAAMLNSRILRIMGNGSGFDSLSIAAGLKPFNDGDKFQEIFIYGLDDTTPITLIDGVGRFQLDGGAPFTMGKRDVWHGMYDPYDDVWVEISRSNN